MQCRCRLAERHGRRLPLLVFERQPPNFLRLLPACARAPARSIIDYVTCAEQMVQQQAINTGCDGGQSLPRARAQSLCQLAFPPWQGPVFGRDSSEQGGTPSTQRQLRGALEPSCEPSCGLRAHGRAVASVPTPWLLVVTNERVQDVRMLSETAHNVASHRRQ